MSESRPDPERILKRVEQEEAEKSRRRGKLKIYLGAAPGVGKTHEMIHDALEEKAKGNDVVIGVVESHGRKEIEKLLHELEIIPKKIIPYHGKKILDFDLDAALKRKPALILIDEMAHTNVPGMTHKKRWQDIKELLDRGINVYTTLNVQHIESLSDDVSQVIHAQIRETVPDSMIEMADTLELVDLPPEELLKRLEEGKVYYAEQADLAAKNFFKRGNLIALRELALRTVAQQVGKQVLLYRQGQGIKHIWPTQEKILVCVGSGLEAQKLIRAAKRTANNRKCEWVAVFVDTPKIKLTETQKNNAIKNLLFAEKLGATTRILTGFDIVKEIMIFAREENVTQIMVWKYIRSRLRNLFFRDLADEIVRHSGEIDIYIMTGESIAFPKDNEPAIQKYSFKNYFISIFVVAIATGLNFLLFPFLSTSTLITVYLLGVTIVALLGEDGPAFFNSILSVIAYGYFFVTPYFSFAVADIQFIFTLVVMLLVSFVISHLTLRVRKQAESARFAERQTAALHTLSRQLASTRGVDKILEIGEQYVGKLFNCEVIILLPKNDQLVSHSKSKLTTLSKKEQEVAKWVYELGKMAGKGTDTLSFSDALYVPLIASQNILGVMRIIQKSQQLFTPDQNYILEACANQIALALEVDKIQEKNRQKELKLETNRVRSELLQNVSHDLHAPLAVVLGEASTLIEMNKELKPKEIKNIGEDIYNEVEQHSRLINNLLQVTYLESGSIKLEKRLTSLPEIINLVVSTSSKKVGNRKIQVDIDKSIPPIPFDSTLMQEILINLLDNAIKFSPDNTQINIIATKDNSNVLISIEDEGPGIVPDEVNKLFEKYYRGRKITSERGLGLGLAICRSIVNAHGGTIWAENRPQGGASFKFTLPIKDDKS